MRKHDNRNDQFHQYGHAQYNMLPRILFALFVLLLFYTQHANAVTKSNLDKRIVTAGIATDELSGLGHKRQADMLQLIRGMRAFSSDDFSRAYRLLLPLAEQGIAEAQFYVGLMYDSGLGTDKNPATAFSWYEQAANKGHSSAQHNLAVAFANGEGTQRDPDKAIHWWKQAAQQGNTDAQYNLGIVYAVGKLGIKPNLKQAKDWWRKAAISGDAMAQYNLGILYANDNSGAVRSYCEAIRWWEESAKNGVQQASTALEILKHKKDYYTCW
ncbi:MAG: sel1 repeat family protein [Gammaproteobacteria bacterium]|nr:sel1 repeat family protein [Gammaproteobacteria bacterium]MDH5653329.1 sel1 repeat family protein [Gammaproteobacteria bacterium]